MVKRIVKILLGMLVGLLVAAGAVWGIFYARSLQLKVTAPPAELNMERTTAVAFGTPFPAELVWRLPRWARVDKIEVQVGAGTLLEGKPITTYTCGTATRECRIKLTLRGIRSGWSEPGKVQLEIAPRPGSTAPQSFTVSIPRVEIQVPTRDSAAPRATADLLAPELKKLPAPPVRWPWYLAGGIGVLVVLLGLLWWLKHRSVIPELSLAERTLRALRELQPRLGGTDGELPAVLTALSDIVRDYLEKRYHIPASRKTTPEFLAALEFDNPLPEAQRPFLRDFLHHSDLIKFAKAPVAVAPLQAAIASAEQLVETTREDAATAEVKHD